ncbi:hypothetical protein SAMN05216559_1919 [Halomicrobium zhouii]|uniref:Uncharacterized protein n=1 Tax=Halomicrobium zhouii TaxID=767519 RepID=A0A1I6L2S4_9EURY|nr:hypothetical protein [Halomicrobium zhouii]SFR97813.1 hypothetical protein SAMN05216559_1919 [Halomicrobium zhouii]
MWDGTAIAAFYELEPDADVVASVIDACSAAGFDVERLVAKDWHETQRESVIVPHDQGSINLEVNHSDERGPDEPAVSLGLGSAIYPSSVDDAVAYQREMDALFELICRLAASVAAGYVAVFDSEGRAMAVVPTSRPIGDALEQPPIVGIYSADVLDQSGGLDGLYDSPPWYTATLPTGQTVVVESEAPWADGGWQPPTEAEYLERAAFGDERASDEVDNPDSRGLADPFAALGPGEYGADVCVHREDISRAFPNEDLRLVRVRVDENGDLRRLDGDTFVRNVVDDDPSDDTAFVKRMLVDVPADATEGDAMVSALLHGSVPTDFVRLDGPDDENVVTKVMELDVGASKFELLVSLGRVAQQDDFTSADLASIEGALETLQQLEDTDAVDRYVRENFL